MAKLPAKGRQQGRPVSEEQKALIFQAYALTGNKEETGRLVGVSAKTVRKVLNEKASTELQAARAKAAVELSEKVHAKAERVIDAITPEKLEASSASQLAVVGGILIDKLPVLERVRAELLAESGESGRMPLPTEEAAMLRVLANKINAIEVLRVELRDPAMEEELRRARALLEQAQSAALDESKVVEAEYEEVDLDNPGRD